MSRLTIGGTSVSVGGNVQTVADWADLAPWAHAWDIAQSTVVNNRVIRVEDSHGEMPMRLMPGSFPLLGGDLATSGPLPGPLWIGDSQRFNGRPACRCDTFSAVGSLFHLFAGLSPNVSGDGTTGPELTSNYFDPPNGYAQPYTVAVLGRLGSPDDPEGSDEDPAAVWDATHGGVGTGPTIGRKIVGLGQPNWQFSNFGPGLVLITVAHTASPDETVLILCHVNGASSFLEVTWRHAGGALQTMRQTGTMLAWNYLECFLGWVHGQYWSATGIILGAAVEADLTKIRNWASGWLPPAGALSEEP